MTILTLAAVPLAAQRPADEQCFPSAAALCARGGAGGDVALAVPGLCVDHLVLGVDSLAARVSLDVRIASLVRVSVGADVSLGAMELTLKGMCARLLLLADLGVVTHMVDEVLTLLDNHPEIVPLLRGPAPPPVALSAATNRRR